MPKDEKVVRKMPDDIKNTLDKIFKMLGDVGNAKKNIGQCKEIVGKPNKC